jgi:TRAP-type C4-dicarboxylate transport system permease small subunit
VLAYVAAAVLMGLMLLTCIDVGGRYFFNSPVWGAFELTEMMLAALIFAGLPLVSLRNDHVTVDLFDPLTPDWLFRIQHAIACAIGVACTAYLAWRLWIRAGNMVAAGETTAQLKITLGWLTYAMSVLMALTAAAFFIVAFRTPQRHHVADEGP